MEFTVSEIAEILRVGPTGLRSLRDAAKMHALGFGRRIDKRGRGEGTQAFGLEAVYRAALFLTLTGHAGFSVKAAAEAVAFTPSLVEAIEATRRGERWRFEIQRLGSEPLEYPAHCDFAPWDAPRSGLHTGEPPIYRAVIDLRVAWGWIQESIEK